MKFSQIIYNNNYTIIDKIDNSGIHTTLARGDSPDEVYEKMSAEDQNNFDISELYKIDQYSTCWVWWFKY